MCISHETLHLPYSETWSTYYLVHKWSRKYWIYLCSHSRRCVLHIRFKLFEFMLCYIQLLIEVLPNSISIVSNYLLVSYLDEYEEQIYIRCKRSLDYNAGRCLLRAIKYTQDLTNNNATVEVYFIPWSVTITVTLEVDFSFMGL